MKVAVIGGSLGGLTAGLALQRLQQIASVDVFEKTPGRLTDGGAGIVLQPEVEEALRRYTQGGSNGVQVSLQRRQFVHKDGTFRAAYMPQPMTSWEAVWKRLRSHFPDASYHAGVRIEGVEELENGKIRVLRGNSEKDACSTTDDEYDLVVAADGAGSKIRQQLLGDKPQYAGYVAYRGTLAVKDASPELVDFFADTFSIYSYPGATRQHMLVYLIPGLGASTQPQDLRINWVWYRNKDFDTTMKDKNGKVRMYSVPPDLLSEDDRQVTYKAAQHFLPPQFAALVHATSTPYIQAVHDMTAPRLVLGQNQRIVLLGDAAGLVRPHTASGTSKAAGDALELADVLEMALAAQEQGTPPSKSSIDQALSVWEEHRLRHLQNLEMRGRRMGDPHGKEANEPAIA